MSQFDIDLGQRIRVLRQAQGHPQQALADLLGLGGRQSISNIEAGRTAVSAESLWKIANFMGVGIDSFFGALTDNAVAMAEIRGRLLTAQYHVAQVVKALADD